MLSVTWCGLRERLVTFLGGFLALALGVGVLTAMGLALASATRTPERQPERFAAAPVLVRGADTLRVDTPAGPREGRWSGPRAVPRALLRELAELGPTVVDRTFPVRAEGAGELVAHPWSTAAFASYRLTAGRAPVRDGEVVAAGGWARPGERVDTDRGVLRVVGTAAAPTVFERAVFLTERHAARFAAGDHVVVDAPPAAVRAVVADGRYPGVRVLTGTERRLADPGTERERAARTALVALLGTAGGVCGFVSVFVVASTFAYSVARRRREFGLLRTAGATPGQVRRTVYAEGLLVGATASAVGCLLGGWAAPLLARLLVARQAAPAGFRIGPDRWPYHLAFWTGLVVALAGVAAASWRAGRTGPAEALREASVDHGVLTRGRLLWGGGLLVAALGLLGYSLVVEPGELLHRKTYTSRPALLVVAVALVAPGWVGPVARALTRLPARLPGAGGELVRAGVSTAVRRGAAVASPVLVTVALTGTLLGTTATLNGAKAREVERRTTADFVVTGVDRAGVAALARVPGAVVSPSAASEVHVLEEGTALVRSEARAVDPAALSATTTLPVAAGDVRDLDDGSLVVNEEWQRHRVGQHVTVWRADGQRVRLRIAAVLRTGTGSQGVYVTPANAPGAVVDRVEVRVVPGARAGAVAAALRTAAGAGRVRTGEAYARALAPRANAATRIGFLLVIGIAVLYGALALANTTLMAAADRLPELRALRLAGATRGQVLRVVGCEAAVLVGTGAVLGALVAAVHLGALAAALALVGAPAPVVVPWGPLAAVGAGYLTVAVLTALWATGRSLLGARR
ncbi:FtsX-like permease family protein [Streptomyces sp. NPDC005955]|uniref:ABC transporter permease n=1 Tax=Streptomyces sp. NPDC005955 TaxID=3364738 RepID=UPI00367F612F